jgi:transcriptional regulator with XRE-family HTH domain
MIDQKALFKAAGKRLAVARAEAGYANQRALADALGISEPAVAKYEQGAREIPMSVLHWLSENHGISAQWIITGNGDPEAANENMIRIKHYNVSAAAGTGLVPVDEHEEQDDIILARSFLRRLGASPEGSQVIFAKGESMLPTIPDGSLLLIDRSKTHIEEGGVFVFRIGEGIKVKRARWRADQRIDLISDNQLAGYPPETYTRDEIATIVPLGRVMCVMRVP